MAVKNAVAKIWHLVPSFDGRLWSAYPTGNKPTGFQLTPTLLKTDFLSGSTSGGEFGKGSYLSLFGYGFGLAADLGTASGARVYIGGVEVDNYRALIASKTYTINQAQQIIVQIGALTGLTPGVNYPVTVVVNGVTSVNPTGYTNDYMINPGNFLFVSLTGNDTTGIVNDINHPYRYLQHIDETDMGGGNVRIDAIHGVFADAGPGDTIVLMGGDYTGDRLGYEGRWCRFFNGTGAFKPTAPTGVAGTGPLTIVSYPGGVLAHDPDVVHYNCGTDGGSSITRTGGILGTHSNAALQGYGQYVWVSGLDIEAPAGGSSDGGFVDAQNSGTGWRCFNCDLGPWHNAGETANDSATGGVGLRMVVSFNYIHDIEGNFEKQNHCIYFGGVEGGTGYVAGSKYCEISYNWIENAVGGSLVQFNFVAANQYLHQNILGIANNGSGGVRVHVPTMVDPVRGNDGTYNVPAGGFMPTNAWVRILGVGGATYVNGLWQITYIDSTHFDIQGLAYNAGMPYTSGGTMEDVSCKHLENTVHHNFLNNSAKYGINFAPGTLSGKTWNNIVINVGFYAFRMCPEPSTAPYVSFYHAHNTVYNPGSTCTEMECNLTTGNITYQHNIFTNGPNTSPSFGMWKYDYNGSGADPNHITVYDRNMYYDFRGLITTKESTDTNGSYANPLFTNVSRDDFTVQSGSPAINAAISTPSIPVADDFYGIIRSLTTPTIGATEGAGV